MRPKILAVLLAGALLALAGCGSTGAQVTTDAQPASNVEPVSLDFTASTLDGSTFEGKQLAGKPTVLWFWAPWCPTCRAQAPGVSKLAQKYADQVNVVAVGGLADEADIRDFAEQVDGPTHLVDVPGAVWRHFSVTAQSSYLVLNAAGEPVVDGYVDDDVLAAKVAELVG